MQDMDEVNERRAARQLLKRQYQKLFNEVRAVLNRHDPWGLLADGAPQDEYEPEVGTILPRLLQAQSPEEVHRMVAEEFQAWFGPAPALVDARFPTVAADLWELRAPDASAGLH